MMVAVMLSNEPRFQPLTKFYATSPMSSLNYQIRYCFTALLFRSGRWVKRGEASSWTSCPIRPIWKQSCIVHLRLINLNSFLIGVDLSLVQKNRFCCLDPSRKRNQKRKKKKSEEYVRCIFSNSQGTTAGVLALV